MHRFRASVALAAAATAFALVTAPADAAAAPFTSTIFKAIHNSYCGNVDGAKGSITSLAAVNQELQAAFGPRLLLAKD
ncbi:hypothetical protein ACWEOE_15940 [Amycolatopsis sp. NPDC004368]